MILQYEQRIGDLQYRIFMTTVAYRLARREAMIAARSYWARAIDIFSYLREIIRDRYVNVMFFVEHWIQWFRGGPHVGLDAYFIPVMPYGQWLSSRYYRAVKPNIQEMLGARNDDDAEGEGGDGEIDEEHID